MTTSYSGRTMKCNEDLECERKKCTFNPLELTHLLDGGVEKTHNRRQMQLFFLSDPELRDEVPIEYLSHKEKYEKSIRKACALFKKVTEYTRTYGSADDYMKVYSGMLGTALFPDGNPFILHFLMFIPTIVGQGTMQQQAYWLERAWNCEIIGTYAQTELGHGTFIRGLETTAHYDPKTKEFVLNSPTLTSYKWWPGALGQTANYAVVMAQLHTQGKCHGIHPFIVQLRDEETHHPLPGIIIGDIGAKLAMNALNHGYVGFKNIRIPRENMLMKHSQVLEDGTYVKSPSDKLTYGTMMFVRVLLVQDMSSRLSKAVTIATRYSAVRRQSELKAGQREPQIIDYITQQYKLFPNIALYFALHFSAKWLWEMYNNVTSELQSGDLEKLPELHVMSCCLKAVATADIAAGVETCRLACGGHGFMISSNLPCIYGHVTAACTYEGENTVMLLQTARFLMKAWGLATRNQALTPTVAYLRQAIDRESDGTFEKTMQGLIHAYWQVAAGKIKLCHQNMERRIQGGYSSEDAWNMTSIELVQCAESHCRAFIVEKFADTISSLKTSDALRPVLVQLCELYATYWVLQRSGDFLRFSSAKPRDIEDVQRWMESLLTLLRPNAVGIVDGFDICDEILRSTLGSWDGQVYQRLFEEASKSPLNREPVNMSFKNYLKPVFKSNL